jgi:hypothetical protein
MTEKELDVMSEIVINKLGRDKKFAKYTSMEIAAILSNCIMQIGIDIGIAIQEEVEKERRTS